MIFGDIRPGMLLMSTDSSYSRLVIGVKIKPLTVILDVIEFGHEGTIDFYQRRYRINDLIAFYAETVLNEGV